MILVDSSVWIDHLHNADEMLTALLDNVQVLTHPFVIGELAVGRLRQRRFTLDLLGGLRYASVARDDEVLDFIEREGLFGLGIGYVDVHLLAATRLTPHALLWAHDKNLMAVAERLSFAARMLH